LAWCSLSVGVTVLSVRVAISQFSDLQVDARHSEQRRPRCVALICWWIAATRLAGVILEFAQHRFDLATYWPGDTQILVNPLS
jgi:hypothetical protein